MLLGLDSLVETIAPAATLHDAARLLIDDLDLAIDDDVLVILGEHRVCLQQLLQRVDTLALHAVVGHQLVLLIDVSLLVDLLLVLLLLQLRELSGDVGQDEELVVIDLGGEPSGTLVGEVAGVEFLVGHEVEGLHSLGHLAVVVGHVVLLGLEHTALDAVLGEELDEGLVLRQGLVGAVEREEALLEDLSLLLGVGLGETLGNLAAGVGEILRGLLALHLIELLYQGLVLLVHLVVALGRGTTDDERRTGVVDQDGVNLIDDGIVVLALHEVGGRHGHVVAEVVEAKLVVGTKGDIGLVGAAALLAVGLVLVDAIDGEAVELIERAHPLGVALGEVVVDSDDVDTIARESVEEDGERGDEGLTLTRGHLGDLALMKHLTTKDLDVVVDHLPLQVVATSGPVVVIDGLVTVDGDEVLGRVGSELAVEVGSRDDGLLVLGEATGRILDDAKGHRHHLVEGLLITIEGLLLQFVDLVEDRLALVDGRILDGGLEAGDLLALLLGGIAHLLADLLRLGAELVVAQGLDGGISGLDLLHEGADGLHIARGFVAEDGL